MTTPTLKCKLKLLMTDLQTIGQELAQILKRQNADYIEAHLEEGQFSSISYRGKQLESISKTSSIGGNVRALVKGGWDVGREMRDKTFGILEPLLNLLLHDGSGVHCSL